MDKTWEQIANDVDRRGRRAFLLTGVVLTTGIGAAALLAGMAPARADPSRKVKAAEAGAGAKPGAAGGAAAHAAPGAAALTVQVTSPRQVTMARTLAASGSIAARDELIVASDAQGVRLVQVTVDIGAVVRRGQLLALGDDAQLQAQLAQQEAQIRDKRAELVQAEANLDRAERIKDSGVYSAEAVQTRRTAVESAAARLDLALAQKRELEVRIAHTRVLAPADGVIVARSATVGAVVQPGMELFRLIRGGEIEWRAELPDHALASVQPGGVVRVRIDESRSVEGRVRLVAPTINARTRNGVVHVALPKDIPGTPLKAGGHAQGELHIGQVEVWTLPEAALLSRDGQAFVYVIGEQGTARAVRVTTGARQGGLVEVRGLPPDARVVATGAGFVKEGERVRVAGPEAGDAVPALPQGGRGAQGLQDAQGIEGVRA
jgi:RND family efflux transporter MFP subunit